MVAIEHQGTPLGSRPGGAAGPAAPAERVVTRRRPLPGGRAVVGGLLVAVAALGLFAAYTDATAGPTTRFVVAAGDLPAGHQLTAGDLHLAAMTLPAGAAARAFSAAEPLIGSVLVAPLSGGELVQASAVSRRGPAGLRQVSFPIDTDLALAGDLAPGERVDVVATFGTGADAYTTTVVAGVAVVSVDSAGGAVGSRVSVVTVALDRPADALAIAHAVRAGQVTLVRSTGAPRPPADTYQPPSPGGPR